MDATAPAPWVPCFISQVSLSLACIMSWKYFSLAIRHAPSLGTRVSEEAARAERGRCRY